MLKFATAEIISAHTSAHGTSALARTAHRADFSHHQVRPGYLYVRSRAISSRCNDNFDEFPASEIEKSYKTFIGKPVFVNHVNHDTGRARGVCIDAALHRDKNPDGTPDVWVEVLMEVDGVRFPKLAAAILAKPPRVYETSMGCDVEYSICSACGNKATRPEEYCRHIPASKGTLYAVTDHKTGVRQTSPIREICYGLKFFENSLLVEPPADPTAQLLGVDATGLGKTSSARRTAMPSRIHPRPQSFYSTITDENGHTVQPGHQKVNDPHCDGRSHASEALYYMEGHDPSNERHPPRHPVAELGYAIHPCGKHISVGALTTPSDQRGRGYASALMDDLYKAYPHAVIDHGYRSADGQGWWSTYDDPEPHRSVSGSRTAHYADTGPQCSRCHHVAGTGPGCPKCDTTKLLHGAIGDLDLGADGHDITWQYRDAGPTLHGTCRNCGRTVEPGAPGMHGDNTDAPTAHSGPCPTAQDRYSPQAADRLTHAVDYLPEPLAPQHLSRRRNLTRVSASTDGYTTCDQGHEHWGTAGAAGELIHHNGHVLLGRRADWVQHGGTWGIPGGALHADESPSEGAHREASEELGGLPALRHTHTHHDDHGGWKYSTVIAEADHPFHPEGGDGETDEFRWVHPSDFHQYDLHPGFAASWPKIAPHVRGGAPKTAARGNWWDAYSTQASRRNTVADQGENHQAARHAASGDDVAPQHDYRFLHTAPDATGVPLHKLLHPSSKQTLRSFENSSPADEETGTAIEAADGRPRARVKIYRAVPSHITTINPGDWVALSSGFARNFAEGRKNHHVIATTAEARHIHTDGNDASEWGYNGPAKNGKIHWKRPVRPVTPDYAGGAVQLSDEDHDFIHGTAPVADRAHRLMHAIPRWDKDTGPYSTGAMHQNKGSYTDSRSDAHYDAQDNVDNLSAAGRPATLFMLHAPQNSRAITGVSFAQHTPPETPMSAYTHHTWGPDQVDEDTGMRHTAALTTEAMPPRHENPAEHPFFKEHPVSAAHVVAHWAQATDEEKAQGKRWYADAHLLAHALAHTYAKGDTGKAAGVISAYSPRQNWAANMHNAARSLAEGRALGLGEGMSVMGQHQKSAQRIIDGEHYNTVLKAPKTNAFAALIHHGGIDPDTKKPMKQVVIDRHALSVAAGKRLSEDDVSGFPSSIPHYYNHVAKTYTDAADAITSSEGHSVAPHEVQAVTWMVRIRKNREEDRTTRGGGGKGRVKNQDNNATKWRDTHRQLLPGGAGDDNMHTSARTGALDSVQAMADGSYRMMHQAPDEESGEPLHEVFGEHPDEPHTVYRAVPRHIHEINKGDWVTPHAEYAHQHALELEPGRRHGHVLQAQVPARHLYTDHNDVNEIGYTGPDLHNVDIHEHPDFPETMHSDEDEEENEEPPHYAGGAVHLSPEDHHFVHDPNRPVAERAHRLMHALPNKYNAPYSAMGHSTGHWDEDSDGAQFDAEDRADKLGDTGSHPATQFVLHSPMGEEVTTGVSWAKHAPDTYFDDFTHHRWPASDIDPDSGLRKHAYGETKAPAQVDTLRDDACDVCGNKEGWDGRSCLVCQYMQVPENFRDPDTGVARTMDLRGVGDAAAQTALDQGADAIPGGTDQAAEQLPGGDPAGGQVPGGVAEGPGGEMEDPNDATVDGEVRTLGDGDGQGDPAAQEAEGQTDVQTAGGEGQMSPTQMPPDAQDVLTCPDCGFQTPAGPPVSSITEDPSIPASAGPVAGDVCPNCGKAVLLSSAEEAGLTPPPEVAALDPQGADAQAVPGEPGQEPQEEAPEEGAPEEEPEEPDDGARGKPRSPAVKRVS